jgi:hypothetical protein
MVRYADGQTIIFLTNGVSVQIGKGAKKQVAKSLKINEERQ